MGISRRLCTGEFLKVFCLLGLVDFGGHTGEAYSRQLSAYRFPVLATEGIQMP